MAYIYLPVVIALYFKNSISYIGLGFLFNTGKKNLSDHIN